VAGEFTIEYSAGDEAFADAAAAQLAGMKRAVEIKTPLKLTLADLRQRREHFLERTASWLSLENPTAEMGDFFAKFIELSERMQMFKELPARVALWRKPELLARLQSGEKISGFTLNGASDVDFHFAFKTTVQEEDGKTIESSTQDVFVFPVVIEQGKGKSPDEEVSSELERLSGMGEMAGGMQRLFVFMVLHETVEGSILNSYITSKDRRWFCDGVANYIAWKIIAEELGPEEAKSYYNLEEQLARYESARTQINLAKWPAAENTEKLNYAEDLNTANYAFATKVIADISAKHGDSLLPKLFREIGKTALEKTTMKTVERAFKTLTREKLSNYLPRPPKKKRGVFFW
jgi:hypothetical protein